MIYSNHNDNKSLLIKIIQTGDIIRVSLSKENMEKKFYDIYISLLKELNLKQKDSYLSNEEGNMISDFDLNSPLKEIIKKFGSKLKLYYEKII